MYAGDRFVSRVHKTVASCLNNCTQYEVPASAGGVKTEESDWGIVYKCRCGLEKQSAWLICISRDAGTLSIVTDCTFA